MTAAHGTLLEEIQQNKPFRSLSHEGVLGLLRTADRLRWSFSRVLEPFGVTHQQYNVLRILRGAGSEGLPTLSIAERMVERTPGITRLVDRLQAKGWVERQRATCDRRQVVCTLSEAGFELLASLDGPTDEADDKALAMLSQEEQRTLIDLLDRVRQLTPVEP